MLAPAPTSQVLADDRARGVVNFMNYEGWEWVLFFSILVRRFLVHGLPAGAIKG